MENTVIFSSCGDKSDSTGLAIYYSRQRLYAVVTTPTLRWTVYTRRVVTEETVTYALSWSQQKGLAIYVNGDRDGRLEKPEARTQVSLASTCDLVVGQTGSTVTVFVLELLQVVYLQKETIDKIGITTGGAFFVSVFLDILACLLAIVNSCCKTSVLLCGKICGYCCISAVISI